MEKLDSINSSNYIKIAAEYFIMAFKYGETPHFKEKTFAKSAYLFLTGSFYSTLINFFSWLYLFISIFEPGNSFDFSTAIDDD